MLSLSQAFTLFLYSLMITFCRENDLTSLPHHNKSESVLLFFSLKIIPIVFHNGWSNNWIVSLFWHVILHNGIFTTEIKNTHTNKPDLLHFAYLFKNWGHSCSCVFGLTSSHSHLLFTSQFTLSFTELISIISMSFSPSWEIKISQIFYFLLLLFFKRSRNMVESKQYPTVF